MRKSYNQIIAENLGIRLQQVENTVKLLSDGATVPFISRYRKELTGSLDEVQIGSVKEQLAKLQEIDARRETILKSVEEQGKLTDELKGKIEAAETLTELEDIYLPYKQKRKTRASMARERGLEPLAQLLFKQQEKDVEERAESYVTDEVPSVDDALQGARDIIAEWVNEDTKARNLVRRHFTREAVVASHLVKGKEEEGIKYKDYFDFSEPLKKCPSHRLMAMLRGEEEGFLRISVDPDEEMTLDDLNNQFVRGRNEAASQVETAVRDSFKRLLSPSIETEFRAMAKAKADDEAIRVFADNLRQLLLASPLGQKRVLAIDPGFRTGCKVVCLDEQGNLLHNEAIYPHEPQKQVKQAATKILSLVESYKIEAISIGNGTASRETEAFIKKVPFT
ncbi:MAG: Tex-like N-terminal domain-containing protein, partial [Bacteroidota bacterium]|nr:Tex-like N-terminal domain-containing protein [Bacteroidota bacterium]